MNKPTKEQAEQAVKLLLEYIGEDTNREGLRDTPKRVIKSYAELFAGYDTQLDDVLSKRFYDVSNYDDVVLLKSISFTSLCEHHMLPFYGTVDIAYVPDKVVLGISKLSRLVNVFAKRLQIQERMTADIANALQENLRPQGVAIRVAATHSCMTTRGTLKEGSTMETSHFTGVYDSDPEKRKEFWNMIK